MTHDLDELVARTVGNLRRASVGGFSSTVAFSIVGSVLGAVMALVSLPALFLQLDVFEIRAHSSSRIAGIPIGPFGDERVAGPAICLGLATLIAFTLAGALSAQSGRSRLAAARHDLLAGAKIALLLAPVAPLVFVTLRAESHPLLVAEVAVLLLVLARVGVVVLAGLGVHGRLSCALREGVRHGRWLLGAAVLVPPAVIVIAAAFPGPLSQTGGSGPWALVAFVGACLVAVHVLAAGALALREISVPEGPDPGAGRSKVPWALAVLAMLVLASEDGVVLSRARGESRLGRELARRARAEIAKIASSTSVEELDAMLGKETLLETSRVLATERVEQLAYLRSLEGGDAEADAFVARFRGEGSRELAPRARAAILHLAARARPFGFFDDPAILRRAREELARALLDDPREDRKAAGVLVRKSLEDSGDWPAVRARLVWSQGARAGDRRAYEDAVSAWLADSLVPARVRVVLDAGSEAEPALVVTLDVQPDPSLAFGPGKFPAENLTLGVTVGSWSKTWTIATSDVSFAGSSPSPTDVSRATASSLLRRIELFPW